MDPLSITAGVVGLLSSLASLSMKLNELRNDFQEAVSDIPQLIHEINDLTQISKRLEEARKRGMLNSGLQNDLGGVLQRLNAAVIETEIHLKAAAGRKLRGAYWAVSGKKQFQQLCRRLESYKSTLNLTLTLSDIISGHEIHERTNEILDGVNDIRTRLSPSNDDYILRKYLEELESVYETSTMGGDLGSVAGGQPANVHYEPQISSIEEENTVSRISSESDEIQPPIDHNPKPDSAEHDLPASSTFNPVEHDSHVSSAIEPGTRDRDHWSKGVKSPKNTFILPFDSLHGNELVARNKNFAGWINHRPRKDNQTDYGFIFRGSVGQATPLEPHKLDANVYDPPNVPCSKRTLTSMALSEDGRLITSLKYSSSVLSYAFVVSWPSSSWLSFQRLSPALHILNNFPLSPNGQYFPHGGHTEVIIFDTLNRVDSVTTINLESTSSAREITWSKNSKKLLLFRLNFDANKYTGSSVDIYTIPNGALVHTVSINDEGVSTTLMDFRYSVPDFDITMVHGDLFEPNKMQKVFKFISDLTPPVEFSHQREAHTGLRLLKDISFSLKIGVRGDNAASDRCSAISLESLSYPVISPDGSCVVGWHTAGKYHRYLQVYDTRTAKVLAKFYLKKHTSISSRSWFEFDGRRVYSFCQDHSKRPSKIELQIWEP